MTQPVTPLTPEQTAAAEAKIPRESYPHRLAVDLDIATDEALGGPMDETISARASRAALVGKWWGIGLSKFLNLFQHDHGPKAQAGDVARAEQVIQLEEKSGGIDAQPK